MIPALTLSVFSLPSFWGEGRLPVRKCVVLLEVGGKKLAYASLHAPAAPGDRASVYTLAVHKPFLSLSSDKAFSCCPQENMSS